jgi:NAD(P)-dependent dehydrogenase (short-subunit alcohol dehydrogenase family)
MGTNCLGPFLFTQLLLPQLRAAAQSSPPASVRIIWTSSGTVDTNASKGGIDLADLAAPPTSKMLNYANSKAGNWFLASEFANLLEKDGIVSLTQNPGNLSTKGWENAPKVAQVIFSYINHPPKYGAYTELWAGLSDDVKMEDGGRYAIPWGRWHGRPRKDILDALKSKEEGGTGQAGNFWKWCEDQTKTYA